MGFCQEVSPISLVATCCDLRSGKRGSVVVCSFPCKARQERPALPVYLITRRRAKRFICMASGIWGRSLALRCSSLLFSSPPFFFVLSHPGPGLLCAHPPPDSPPSSASRQPSVATSARASRPRLVARMLIKRSSTQSETRPAAMERKIWWRRPVVSATPRNGLASSTSRSRRQPHPRRLACGRRVRRGRRRESASELAARPASRTSSSPGAGACACIGCASVVIPQAVQRAAIGASGCPQLVQRLLVHDGFRLAWGCAGPGFHRSFLHSRPGLLCTRKTLHP